MCEEVHAHQLLSYGAEKVMSLNKPMSVNSCGQGPTVITRQQIENPAKHFIVLQVHHLQ